ncbi:Serine phosphatase RsbU, regulator of sigma subunit [Anaerovibrio sp. JC8]|uniref:SpoIIE family protein phosphatase n=1 Tax=Anaerovibrio sp. JC8 TaxID=1240085 RepID=UPI000A0B2493|nr:SpoIIE family protein phosphatase [Anaerovibrio sp. JC8]ORU00674.1 Serine phosphatase RsbU, regulator of sigma subunit [Anaerovibrio sp. JC8]
MLKKLHAKWFLQKGSIRSRIFRLLLLTSMTIFVIMGALMAYSLYAVNDDFMSQSDQLSDTSANYMEKVTSKEITERLTDVAQTRAKSIETELWEITNNTSYLASGVENILSHPEYYGDRQLPDPRFQPIVPGEVYLHQGARLQAAGETPAIRREIGLISNVAAYIEPMARQYRHYESSLFVGSKHGYIIAADNVPGKDFVPMTEEFLQTYEPTERGWYKNTQDRGKITFNDIYVGADGYPSFTCSAPYNDENGFAGVVAIACSVKSISDIMESSLMGDTGISFVMNNRGNIMLSTSHDGALSDVKGTNLRKSDNISLSSAAVKMLAGEKGWQLVELDGEEYFLAYAPMSKINWSFGTLIAKYEVMTPIVIARENIVAQVNDFRKMMKGHIVNVVLVAIISVWSALVLLFNLSSWLTNRFVEPIKKLTSGVQEIADGNLEKKISLRTGDELEKLAKAFNNMTDELQNYMDHLTKATMEKEHIATELAVATDIQESMLPHTFPFAPEHTEFDIYATMQAAKEVGGDFYDFYMVDDEHLLVTIADVSGKGIPAALFMVVARTLLKNSGMAIDNVDELAEVVERTNDQLCQNNDAMMFVTAFVGILHLPTGQFNYVNAGHNPPLLYRASENSFEYLKVERNFVMGGMDGISYKEQKLTLQKNDRLLLYTDGVTEALNEAKELFGEKRLLDALNNAKAGEKTTQELLQDLKNVLNDYVGQAQQSDDMTMLALLYNGSADK